MSGVLPKNLMFPALQPTGVAAASKTNIIYPIAAASSFTPGGQIVFEIPAGERALWLQPENTYLQFKVTVSATVATGKTAAWHAFPWDFVRSLETYASSGSVLVEQISDYPIVHSVCRDLQSDLSNIRTSDEIMLCADSDSLRFPEGNTLAAGVASTSSYTYAMPLVSVISTLSAGGQYIPLHALSSPLRVVLQLNSVAAALGLSGDAADVTLLTYTVSNPILSTSMLTLSDAAQQQITEMTSGVYQWSGTSYHTYRTTHPAQQASNSISIPARFTSVRALLTAVRPTAQLESSLHLSTMHRVKNYLSTAQHMLGSIMLDPRPIDCTGTAIGEYLQLRKIFSTVASETQPTLLSRNAYQEQVIQTCKDQQAGTQNLGCFLIGSLLQPYGPAANITQGMSSAASNFTLELKFSTADVTNVVACAIDTIVAADAVFSVAGGQLTIAF